MLSSQILHTGALPPMVSVTFVRVTNFSVYQKAKYAISDAFERTTGEAPLVLYNTPGSLPTFSTVTCFTIAGMVAGLAATPLACKHSQVCFCLAPFLYNVSHY